jgi:predicted RNA binding protein YcfA (HicA-like mRNA interferase family)
MKERRRIIVPFHSGKTLHPKIVKQVLEAVEEKN